MEHDLGANIIIVLKCLKPSPVLVQSLKAVHNQSYPKWQLLFLTDNNTLSLNHEIKQDSRFFQHNTKGSDQPIFPDHFDNFSPDIVVYLRPEEIWHPHHLQNVLNALRSQEAGKTCISSLLLRPFVFDQLGRSICLGWGVRDLVHSDPRAGLTPRISLAFKMSWPRLPESALLDELLDMESVLNRLKTANNVEMAEPAGDCWLEVDSDYINDRQDYKDNTRRSFACFQLSDYPAGMETEDIYRLASRKISEGVTNAAFSDLEGFLHQADNAKVISHLAPAILDAATSEDQRRAARAWLAQAINSPYGGNNFITLGELQLRAGKFDEAVKYFQPLGHEIRAIPNLGQQGPLLESAEAPFPAEQALLGLAQCALQKGRPNDALPFLDLGLKLNSKCMGAHVGSMQANLSLGDITACSKNILAAFDQFGSGGELVSHIFNLLLLLYKHGLAAQAEGLLVELLKTGGPEQSALHIIRDVLLKAADQRVNLLTPKLANLLQSKMSSGDYLLLQADINFTAHRLNVALSQYSSIASQESANSPSIQAKIKKTQAMIKNDQRALQLNGRHAGETIFVIGAGPQLANLHPEEIDALQNRVTIGLNRVQYLLNLTYFISAYNTEIYLARLRNNARVRVHHRAIYTDLRDPEAITVKRRVFSPKTGLHREFSASEPTLYTKRNAALAGLHLAFILGAKKIVTLGIEQNSFLHYYNIRQEIRDQIADDLLRVFNDPNHEVDHQSDTLDYHLEYLLKSSEQLDEITYSEEFKPRDFIFRDYFSIFSKAGVEVISTTPDSVIKRAGAKFIPLNELLAI